MPLPTKKLGSKSLGRDLRRLRAALNIQPIKLVASSLEIDATIYINDNSNSFSTIGLTVNQGANDDEIIALKSSDVAHGMTDLTDTDTYCLFKKRSATQGGLNIQAYTEGSIGIQMYSSYVTGNTGKNASANGAFNLTGRLKSGTTVTTMGSDHNIIVFIWFSILPAWSSIPKKP
jgi:hypothetical protein